MSLKELERNVFIFTLWTFVYFSLLRWFLISNWNFDIVAGWHWRYIAYQWWYGGWVITGVYYWIFVFTIFLSVPLWIIGYCISATVKYKKIYENLFWDKIYQRKLNKIKTDGDNAKIKRKPSYKEVRPKPLQYVNFQVAPPKNNVTPGDIFEQASAQAIQEHTELSPTFAPTTDTLTPMAPVEIDTYTEITPENIEPVSENPEEIMASANCRVLKNIKIGEEIIDYIAVSEDTLYLCMNDNEPGDWLADEERFNNEEPLWFSETSHRVSPVTTLNNLKDNVLTTLMNAGMPYKAVPILIKTQGNIINAEDIMNVWKDLETVVCRINTGMPEELPTFGKVFPTENQLPSDDVFAKITALLS